MGRPRKMVPERTEAILVALRNGHTRTAAAALVDVHYATMARMVATDAEFRVAVENAEGIATGRYEQIVARAAEQPRNWTAAAWWLERRHYESYGRRDRVEMTVDLRGLAAKVAAEDGLEADALIAEAERIIAAR